MRGLRPTYTYSQTRDGGGKHLSGYGKTQTDRRALTSWRRQREAPVSTRKESYRPTRTHQLETRGRHLSEHGKNPTSRRALTDWRRQREAHKYQNMERVRPTDVHSHPGDDRGRHLLGHIRNRLTNAHSLPGDGRERHLSGHGKK